VVATLRSWDRVHCSGFDEVLGPAVYRYFATGYRRVEYVAVPRTLAGDLTCISVQVTYPPDWSADSAGAVRTPHLSTIDAVVIACGVAEAVLTSVVNLDGEAVGSAYVADLDVRAGREAVDVASPIEVEVKAVATSPASSGRHRTTIAMSIGSFVAGISVVHDRPTEVSPLAHGLMRELTSGRVYGEHFRAASHNAKVVQVTEHFTAVRCALSVEPGPAVPAPVGLSSHYWPSVTMVDSLVLAGQMAQLLLAKADPDLRRQLGNLWMRRVTLELDVPEVAQANTELAELKLVASRDFTVNGRRLHSRTVESGSIFGMRIRADLAYSVPVPVRSS